MVAFEETAGPDILRKCSRFIDLAVYYEAYLAAQNCEQDEESVAEQVQDLLESQKSDLDEEDVQFPVDQVDKQAGVPTSDLIDELGL